MLCCLRLEVRGEKVVQLSTRTFSTLSHLTSNPVHERCHSRECGWEARVAAGTADEWSDANQQSGSVLLDCQRTAWVTFAHANIASTGSRPWSTNFRRIPSELSQNCKKSNLRVLFRIRVGKRMRHSEFVITVTSMNLRYLEIDWSDEKSPQPDTTATSPTKSLSGSAVCGKATTWIALLSGTGEDILMTAMSFVRTVGS